MEIAIPGQDPFEITTLILDLNGTLTIDGILIPGVKERIEKIQREQKLRTVLFTGDTLGTGGAIAKELDIEVRKTPTALDKRSEAWKLGAKESATIGNGNIDLELFKVTRFRIMVLQDE